MKKSFLFFAFIFYSLVTLAQTNKPMWQHFFDEESRITSTAFDGNILWIGSIEFLIKYDKVADTVIKKYDFTNSGFGEISIYNMVVDDYGTLWLNTSNGIYTFQNEQLILIYSFLNQVNSFICERPNSNGIFYFTSTSPFTSLYMVYFGANGNGFSCDSIHVNNISLLNIARTGGIEFKSKIYIPINYSENLLNDKNQMAIYDINQNTWSIDSTHFFNHLMNVTADTNNLYVQYHKSSNDTLPLLTIFDGTSSTHVFSPVAPTGINNLEKYYGLTAFNNIVSIKLQNLIYQVDVNTNQVSTYVTTNDNSYDNYDENNLIYSYNFQTQDNLNYYSYNKVDSVEYNTANNFYYVFKLCKMNISNLQWNNVHFNTYTNAKYLMIFLNSNKNEIYSISVHSIDKLDTLFNNLNTVPFYNCPNKYLDYYDRKPIVDTFGTVFFPYIDSMSNGSYEDLINCTNIFGSNNYNTQFNKNILKLNVDINNNLLITTTDTNINGYRMFYVYKNNTFYVVNFDSFIVSHYPAANYTAYDYYKSIINGIAYTVYYMVNLQNNQIFVCLVSYNNGTYTLYNNTNTNNCLNINLAPYYYRRIYDDNNSIYIQVDSAIVKFDGTNWSKQYMPSTLWGNASLSLMAYYNNKYWFYNSLNINGSYSIISVNGNQIVNYPCNININTYYLRLIDQAGRFWFQDGYIFDPNGSLPNYINATISGYVFVDANNNGSKDIGEVGIANQQIKLDNYSITTDQNGYYEILVHKDIDTIFLKVYPSIFPTIDSIVYQIPSNSNVSINNNFPCSFIPNQNDLAVTLTPTGFNPGFNAQYFITATNLGSTTQSGVFGIKLDNNLTYIQSNGGTFISPDSVYWTFTNLAPLQSITQSVVVNTPSTTSIGTVLASRAGITSINNDIDSSNNSYSLQHIVSGAYDPNLKTTNNIDANGNSIADANGWLTYTIQFQNTGTDTAINISVIDTLSSYFDLNSLQILSYSHFCNYETRDNVVKFNFKNILLVDSFTNEPLSHGFVQFKIKYNSTVTPSTQVSNTAYIYFDYNAPVQTNVNLSQYPSTGINTLAIHNKQITVFPNPVDKWLYCAMPELPLDRIEIYNNIGQCQTIKGDKLQINKKYCTINVSDFSAGIYLIKEIDNKGNAYTAKFIKQ